MEGRADREALPPSAFTMDAELLSEWLVILSKENNTRRENATAKQGHFKNVPNVQLIFQVCLKYDLPNDVRFLALEILDRFMVVHLQDLHTRSIAQSSTGDVKRNWRAIVKRVKSQMPLRAVSCCQLASKITCSYKMLSSTKVWNLLQSFGFKYQLKSIVDSEFRVLETIKYQVMITTPLVYLESLLAILGYNDTSVKPLTYHSVCIDVLDMIMIHREDIYANYLQVWRSKRTPPKDLDLGCEAASVACDYLLMSAATILASVYIIDNNRVNSILGSLEKITRIPEDSILDFSCVIINKIRADNSLQGITCRGLPVEHINNVEG